MNIKIFGERNTGTNAVYSIIKKNSKSYVYPGTAKELNPLFFIKLKIAKLFNANSSVIERLIDSEFKNKSIEESWKHTATLFDSSLVDRNTHFIFTVRDPLSWFLSFYKNPYHSLINIPDNILDFYSINWKVLSRDNLNRKLYTPVEMYEEKLKSYKIFLEGLDSVGISYTLLRFEDLILDQEGCFNKIKPYLDDPDSTFSVLESSTKDKNKDLSYYKKYYGNDLWREELDDLILELFSFDKDLIKFMGY